MTLITGEQEVAIKALYTTACNIYDSETDPGLRASMKFTIDWCERFFNDLIHNHDTSRNSSLSEGS
jgi:hypothetical protein